MDTKVCTKCKKEKPLSDFYKRKERGGLGVRSKCKECERKISKEYQTAYRKSEKYNSEECKAKRNSQYKAYRDRNRDKINERSKIRNHNKYYDIRHRLMKLRQSMKRRCYNPKCDKYHWYGGKGIKIEWNSFEEFYSDMKSSYEEHVKMFGYGRKNTQIDRIDPDGNYSKENCRWVTAKENNHYNHDKEFTL